MGSGAGRVRMSSRRGRHKGVQGREGMASGFTGNEIAVELRGEGRFARGASA